MTKQKISGMSRNPGKPRIGYRPVKVDNMPENMTCHAVRRLVPCSICAGFGDRDQMIAGDTHTSCFVEKMGYTGLMVLSVSDLNKIRLCDVESLTTAQKRRVFAKAMS